MDLEKMVNEFCKRSKVDYTKEQVKEIILNNYCIFDEDGFITFNFFLDESHVFFCYVTPGKDGVFKKLVNQMESISKKNKCTKVKFITKRGKAFERVLSEYTQCSVMYEKIL